MQTFLPYPDFAASAACLDYRRLGKQRVECLQICKAIANSSYGWQNHPAVNMWRNSGFSLLRYGEAICIEWRKRGFKDTLHTWFQDAITYRMFDACIQPSWLGNPNLHSSHRAALLAKDPAHYGQFGWTEEPKIDYWWPTKELAV